MIMPDLVELIVLAAGKTNLRCLRLPEREIITLRPVGGVRDETEGEIIRVIPYKKWEYNKHTYLSGKVIDSYIDGSVLTPVPLRLYSHGSWDSFYYFAELWEIDPDLELPSSLPEWVIAVLKAGPREVFEMEQIIPGADPEDIEDPISLAVEYAQQGNIDKTWEILQECLTKDLRCIDAFAHLGTYTLGDGRSTWHAKKAMKRYLAGVSVGEQALPPGFNGLLPWSWINNRPFLRALHGLGLCQWRLGQFDAACKTFRRILMFDPMDALGCRFILPDVEKGREYLAAMAEENRPYF